MDVLSYLCWSRAECGELCKYELSLFDHLAHPCSFPSCLFMPTPLLTLFAHPSLVLFLSLFRLYIWSCAFLSFSPHFMFTPPLLPVPSSPSTLLSVFLFGLSAPLFVVLPISFSCFSLFYSLTFTCTNRLTPSSIPHSSSFPQCPFPPPLTPSLSPTCPRPGQSRTSPLSICLFVSLSLPLLSHFIYLSLRLQWVAWLN